MVTTILLTIWATMSFCYCLKEWINPYSGDLWLFDILFSPYYLIDDAIDQYKEWRKPSEILLSKKAEYDPHETSNVKCDLCSHSWVAVRPLGVEKLECPNCGNMVNFENI